GLIIWIPLIGHVLCALILTPYWLLRDINGASLGKTILGLRVVQADGSESTTNQRITRNIPIALGPALMIVPFAGFIAGPGLWFIVLVVEAVLTVAQGQRLGDKLAGTIVVRKGPAAQSATGS